MGVHAKGERRVRVPQPLGNPTDVLPGLESQGRPRVARAVELERADAELLGPALHAPDPRILLRIGDRLYEGQLVRIQAGPSVAPLLEQLGSKYVAGSEVQLEVVTSGYLLLYELAPRG
jgi:hypothetical protein